MVFTIFKADCPNGTIFNTFSTQDTIFVELTKGSRVIRKEKLGNHTGDPASNSFFCNQSFGKTKSAKSTSISNVALGPIAGVKLVDLVAILAGIHEKFWIN